MCAPNCVFYKHPQKQSYYIHTKESIAVESEAWKPAFGTWDVFFLWVWMMDGAGRLSLWLTASDHHRVSRDRYRTGPPAWLFFQPSVAVVLSFTHPLSPVSIHIPLHLSIKTIQSSITGPPHHRPDFLLHAACFIKAKHHKQLHWEKIFEPRGGKYKEFN